ncbi:MAG: fumarylacetoacetate hydrolase family protein [Oceanospirillaceae bacterium]|nr:fumarylacetoacetate hydrolase family protein [Oceanospirillaceae bacterium]
MSSLPLDSESANLIARVFREDLKGPSLCVIRSARMFDITSPEVPTVRDLLELDDPVSYLKAAGGEDLGDVEQICKAKVQGVRLLAPCDLQAIKACGVTFANSMIERMIEERAGGDPAQATKIRSRITALIGSNLSDTVPGSEQAQRVKKALIGEGLWSQYLEVGIGPDAEVFTKSQPLSAVGSGAEVGLHPSSHWNNPEPEVVLAVNSQGKVQGATLGNDVNLRDIEGRSALLLGKAKDNNASCSIGPFIRLFDQHFSIEDVRNAELALTVKGVDGFELKGHSCMSQISRDPLDLVKQTCGDHHQYPDGFMLFLGTLFSPTQDRDKVGEGFTHKLGDQVHISSEKFGCLSNTVNLSTLCAPWVFSASHLMRNLAARKLL